MMVKNETQTLAFSTGREPVVCFSLESLEVQLSDWNWVMVQESSTTFSFLFESFFIIIPEALTNRASNQFPKRNFLLNGLWFQSSMIGGEGDGDQRVGDEEVVDFIYIYIYIYIFPSFVQSFHSAHVSGNTIVGETPKIFNGSKDSMYEVEPCELHVKRWV